MGQFLSHICMLYLSFEMKFTFHKKKKKSPTRFGPLLIPTTWASTFSPLTHHHHLLPTLSFHGPACIKRGEGPSPQKWTKQSCTATTPSSSSSTRLPAPTTPIPPLPRPLRRAPHGGDMAEYRLGLQLHGHADDVSRRSPPPLSPPRYTLATDCPRLSLLPLQACGDTLGLDPPGAPLVGPRPRPCSGSVSARGGTAGAFDLLVRGGFVQWFDLASLRSCLPGLCLGPLSWVLPRSAWCVPGSCPCIGGM